MGDETVTELEGLLLLDEPPDRDVASWLRRWDGWGYGCRVERDDADGVDVFKGGAFAMVRFDERPAELPWDEIEQQAALLAGIADTFDHGAALAAARRSGHHAKVTVRVLEPGPWIVLTELLITLAGLAAAMAGAAVFLPHCQALLTGQEFLADAEALRLDRRGGGAEHPYGLYVSIQLRLPLERGGCAVGFTRGLAHFGWPDFEIEDFVGAPTPAVLHRTLVNAALHQLMSKGAIGPDERVLTSTGRLATGTVRRSLNFDGDVLPLAFLS